MKSRDIILAGAAFLFAFPVSAQIVEGESGGFNLGKAKFGLGLGAVGDLGKIDRVTGAQIVNGIVRVDEESNNTIRPIFEMHVFPWSVNGDKIVYGPFVAAELSAGSVVNGFGAGIMVGFRTSENEGTVSNKDRDTLNFGLGVILDPHIKTLGNGFVEDAAPPAGEVEVRYKHRSELGILFMTSYGF